MSRVKYILNVEVDNAMVFHGEYEDSVGLEDDLYKADYAVDQVFELENEDPLEIEDDA